MVFHVQNLFEPNRKRLNVVNMNSRKITILIILILVFGGVSWFSVWKKIPGRAVEEYDFQPTPYTSLGQCERKSSGEINCPDIRHKGKTRLRQAQLVLTRILRIFDLIAKKHGVTYWLYKGTLLGSVRHNGHVPFDNDVDVCIPKADFEKFIKYGVKDLPDDIFFQTEETDVNWKSPSNSNMFGKLRDTRSCLKTCYGKCKFNDGLMLDFFIVETDSDGNFLELFTHTSGFLRNLCLFIYGPIVRKQSEIFPLTELKFDGFAFPAPREWRKNLQSYFGDFMTVPANQPLGHIITDPLNSCDEIKI